MLKLDILHDALLKILKNVSKISPRLCNVYIKILPTFSAPYIANRTARFLHN